VSRHSHTQLQPALEGKLEAPHTFPRERDEREEKLEVKFLSVENTYGIQCRHVENYADIFVTWKAGEKISSR
jgi:hypothetical protein